MWWTSAESKQGNCRISKYFVRHFVPHHPLCINSYSRSDQTPTRAAKCYCCIHSIKADIWTPYSIVEFTNKVCIQGLALFATAKQKHEGLLIAVVVTKIQLFKISISLVDTIPVHDDFAVSLVYPVWSPQLKKVSAGNWFVCWWERDHSTT